MNQKYILLGVDDLGRAYYTLNSEWDSGLEDYLAAFYVDDDLRYIVLGEYDTFWTYTVVDTFDNEIVEYCGCDWRRANRSAGKINNYEDN